jgi:hypothetical protein
MPYSFASSPKQRSRRERLARWDSGPFSHSIGAACLASGRIARMILRVCIFFPLLVAPAGGAAAQAGAPASSAPEDVTAAAIVLPQRIVAGQPATLAVLSADGRLLPRVAVQFSGGQQVTTDGTGRALFTAPAEPGVLLAEIPGSSIDASATVFAAGPPATLGLSQLPRMVSLTDRVVVSGTGFRGEADANRVQLGGQPALVLAASPLTLSVISSKKASLGPARLVIDVGGAEATTTTTLVAFELTSEKPRIPPRKKGKLFVRVLGSTQPLELEARNQTPDVIRFRRGDVQRLLTSGGAENTARIEVEGLRTGEFAFSVRLVPAPAGLPDTESARQFLLAALRVAPKRDAHRVEKLIRRLEQRPQEAIPVRTELEKMLARKPEGQYGRLLESAWEVLLNR